MNTEKRNTDNLIICSNYVLQIWTEPIGKIDLVL